MNTTFPESYPVRENLDRVYFSHRCYSFPTIHDTYPETGNAGLKYFFIFGRIN